MNPARQVLMSSHSPYFIDWSEDRPEELTLMQEVDGWVEVRNLKDVKDLRYFLEEDAWGQEWVAKFFRTDYALEEAEPPDEYTDDENSEENDFYK
jgi:hypothetical protein